jgi:hypothetical protein
VADDVRQLVMFAQAAERSGDLRMAQELLEQAARACEAAGRTARAEQLRRHALRLAETLPGDAKRPFVERLPALADPAVSAWCSFCCRPDGEVGRLVAGPAGAFICKACVLRAQGLLGEDTGGDG